VSGRAEFSSTEGIVLTLEEARERALAALNAAYDQENDTLVIGDDYTISRPYGWVFFYQSRRFLENGDPSDALAGNGPVVVLSRDGSIHHLGSAHPVEETLRQFEARIGTRG
jgi:hypothetical protein